MAGGLALGLFIGFSPTMGAQIILAGAAAYFLRVNIPMALLGSLVTNPFTAAIVYPLEYQLGIWLMGAPQSHELEGYTGLLRNFARYAKPLWIGSMVCSAISAAIAYALVSLLWVEAEHFRSARHRGSTPPAPHPDAEAPAPSAAPVESVGNEVGPKSR